MPLDQATLDLLNLIPAEDRAALTSQFEKHAVLREGVMRQADYSRKMNEVNEEVTKARPIVDWYEKEGRTAVERANKNVEYFEAEKAKRESLEAQLSELTAKAASAANVDPETLVAGVTAKLLASNGHLSQEGLTRLIATEASKIADQRQQDFFARTLPETILFTESMIDAKFRYEKEFGSPLDRAAFAKFMTDNRISDPTRAYEQFTAEPRKVIEIEAAKKSAVEEYVRKNQVTPGTGVMPATGEMGAVQRKVLAAAGGEQFGSGPAADALIAAGKF